MARERIGTAYVRIVADGRDLPQSVRDELNDLDTVMESKGEDHGEAYAKGFEKEAEKRDPAKNLVNKLEKSRGRFDAEGQKIGDVLGSGIRERLVASFGDDIGGVMFKNLERDLNEGRVNVNRVGSSFTNLRAEVTKAVREVERINLETDRFRETSRKVGNQFANIFIDANQEMIRTRALISDTLRLTGDLNEELVRGETVAVNEEERITRYKRMNGALDNLIKSVDHFGDATGKAFGKGSRNDFINFFGSIVGGLAALPARFTSVVQTIANFGDKLNDAFEKNGGGASGLIAVVGILTGRLVGLVAGFGFLYAVLGPVAALISVLTGAVIALTAALGFALVGAAGAAAGALGALVVAGGVVALAIANMDEATKKAFGGIKDSFAELGSGAASIIFSDAAAQAGVLEAAVAKLKPVVDAVAFALKGILDGFIEALQRPEFNQFIDRLAVELPPVVAALGDAFIAWGAALGAIFLATLPLAERFAGWLEDIANGITKAGEGGKNSSLQQFFDDAQESLSAVWDFINSVLGALGDLFSAGRSEGNDMFTRLADQADRLREAIQEAAENGTLQKWFEDAGRIAGKIGEIVVQVGLFIAALDNEVSRTILEALLTVFEGIFKAVTDLIVPIGILAGALIGLSVAGAASAFSFSGASAAAIAFVGSSNLARGATVLWTGAQWLLNAALTANPIALVVVAIAGLVAGLVIAYNQSETFRRIVNNAFNSVKGAAQDVWNWVKNNFPKLLGILTAPFTGSIGAIQTAFSNIKGFATDTKAWIGTKVGEIKSAFDELPEKLGNLASTMFTKAKTLGGEIMSGLKSGISGLASIAGSIATAAFDKIVSMINSAIDAINNAIPDSLGKGPLKIDLPNDPIPHLSFAAGGIIGERTFAEMGEEGREAVVPLDRPLSQIDPAVRELAAFAQGRLRAPNSPFGRSTTVEVGGVSIVTPSRNPETVAREVINQIAAAAFVG